MVNGDEYLDQSALALQPWFCWSQRYFRCRLPPFAAITPLPAVRNHISLLAFTCCFCRSVPTFSWDVAIRAIECVFGHTRGRRGIVRAFVPLSRVVCACVRVTTTRRVCWYLAERRWLPWLRVSKRFVRFGSGCSEMSGAKDSKAVLSCECPEERPAFACLFAARKR